MCDAMGYISAVYLPSPSSGSGKCFLVTAIGNSSISDAHTAFAPARSKARGNPPMPSKRLAIVTWRSYWAQIRLARNSQNGSAMELPNALYLGESASLCVLPLLSTQSPISTQPSGKPWSRVHSKGVSRRTMLVPMTGRSFSCALSVVLVPSSVMPL